MGLSDGPLVVRLASSSERVVKRLRLRIGSSYEPEAVTTAADGRAAVFAADGPMLAPNLRVGLAFSSMLLLPLALYSQIVILAWQLWQGSQ